MLNIIVEQITSLGDGVLMIGSLAYILGVRKGKSNRAPCSFRLDGN